MRIGAIDVEKFDGVQEAFVKIHFHVHNHRRSTDYKQITNRYNMNNTQAVNNSDSSINKFWPCMKSMMYFCNCIFDGGGNIFV